MDGPAGWATLRLLRDEDAGFLDRLCDDPGALGPFEWSGFTDLRARRFTTAHRLQAVTDTANAAERKALERIGFRQEGVLREAYFRDGWRDLVMYALLRHER